MGAYERERRTAASAVQQAARFCRAVRREASAAALAKGDRTPVTLADLGSQALICAALAAAFPDDPVIGEEDAGLLRDPANRHLMDALRAALGRLPEPRPALLGEGVPTAAALERMIDRGGERAYRQRFWTVDPIDGTKGFIRGDQYAIGLALVVEGRLAVAALACPGFGRLGVAAGDAEAEAGDAEAGAGDAEAGAGDAEAGAGDAEGEAGDAEAGAGDAEAGAGVGALFLAEAGEGAWAGGLDGALRDGFCGGDAGWGARIRVSERTEPAELRLCESVEDGHTDRAISAGVVAALGIARPPLRLDSMAKYAAVARGDADAYLRFPWPGYAEKVWDHAAGALLVLEAGGRVTDLAGRPLDLTRGAALPAEGGIVASNGACHDLLLAAARAQR